MSRADLLRSTVHPFTADDIPAPAEPPPDVRLALAQAVDRFLFEGLPCAAHSSAPAAPATAESILAAIDRAADVLDRYRLDEAESLARTGAELVIGERMPTDAVRLRMSPADVDKVERASDSVGLRNDPTATIATFCGIQIISDPRVPAGTFRIVAGVGAYGRIQDARRRQARRPAGPFYRTENMS